MKTKNKIERKSGDEKRQGTAAVQDLAEKGEFRSVAIKAIAPSMTQPRQNFDEGKLAELAASIEAQGVAVPLLLRPIAKLQLLEPDLISHEFRMVHRLPDGTTVPIKGCAWPKSEEKKARGEFAKWLEKEWNQKEFELVDGERRWRAAKLAKLTHVPAIVRVLSDQQVIELQLLSFLREELTPLEEAESYRKLIDGGIHTAESLSAKLGITRSVIFEKMRLAKLTEAPKEALKGEKISASVAALIAGVPGHLQKQLTAEVLEGDWRSEGQPLSYRAAEGHIKEHYRRNLTEANWKLDDAVLDAKAGACKGCAKNQAPGICTDVVCFANKRELVFKAKEAAAVAKGQKVLSAKEWEKARCSDKYVKLDDRAWQYGEKNWRTLVKGCEELPTLARDKHEGLIEVMPRDVAVAAAYKNGFKSEAGGGGSGYEAKQRAEQKKSKAKRDMMRLVLEEALTQIGEKAHDEEPFVVLWQVLGQVALNQISMYGGQLNEIGVLVKRLGIDAKTLDAEQVELRIVDRIKGFTGVSEARAFALQLWALHNWMSYYNVEYGENFLMICQHYGVDLKGLEREVARKDTKTKKGGKGEKCGAKDEEVAA